MLSDKLLRLSGHFHEWARQGAHLDARVLGLMSEELREHAADAVRLEAAQMPPGYRLPAAPDALPANVVQVDFVGHSLRNYRGFLQGVAGGTPGGAA